MDVDAAVTEGTNHVVTERRIDDSRILVLRAGLSQMSTDLGRAPSPGELRRFLDENNVVEAEVERLLALPTLHPREQAPGSAAGGTVSGSVRQIPEPRIVDEPPTPAASCTPVDKDVRRTVDDLVDDWARAGEELQFEDVARLIAKRSLSAEQAAVVLAALRENGIELDNGDEPEADAGPEDQGAPPTHDRSPDGFDGVGAYLREIRSYALIYAEDEQRLGRQIRAGVAASAVLDDPDRLATLPTGYRRELELARASGKKAHNALVCANLRLVVSIAKKRSFEGSGVEFLDRIQDGNLGLMRAADKFDPDKGFKFSTYATWWIRQAITRGIGDRGRLIRLPIHVVEQLAQLTKIRSELFHKLGRTATVHEIAVEMDRDPSHVQALTDWSHTPASLDMRPIEDNDVAFGDLLAADADIDGRTDPLECVIRSNMQRDIDRALLALDPRSGDVILRRFGFCEHDEQTLDEIGRVYAVTRERIRQIEGKAMYRLRSSPESLRALQTYLYHDCPDRLMLAPNAKAPQRRKTAKRVHPPVRGRASSGLAEAERQEFLNTTIAEIVDVS